MDLFQLAVDLFGTERVTDHGNTQTCVGLMKEFLRRQALWACQLELKEELPFPDLAGALEPAINSPAELSETLKVFVRSMAEYKCCENLLRWYFLIKKQGGIAGRSSLPDPFLPLIYFFQRGGYFTREHRFFIEINGGSTNTLDSRTIQSGKLDSPFAELDQSGVAELHT